MAVVNVNVMLMLLCAGAISISMGSNVCSIVDYGAIGDNHTLNTAAIQSAIDTCHSQHPEGSMVVVPKGNFQTASISLRSNMRFHLETGAGLFGSSNASDYNYSRQWFAGHYDYEFNALIFAHNLTNISVTGSNGPTLPGHDSIIDGVGWTWWCEAQCMPLPQPWCAQFNPNKNPLPKNLLPKPQGQGRPRLIHVFNCTDVTLAGFTAQNSPHWTTHIANSNRVLVQNLTVLSPRAVGNTDGIDPDSSSNVLITDSYVSVGDDGISIKSTNITIDGVNTMAPCDNITMRRLQVVSRNWCIGSGTFGGISNILFEDSTVGQPSDGNGGETIPVPWAFKFKSHPGHPGPIENVTVRRIHVAPVTSTPWMYNDTQKLFGAFELGLMYGKSEPNATMNPFAKNVTFQDIVIDYADTPGSIIGLPKECMQHFSFINVTFRKTKVDTWQCRHVDSNSLVQHGVVPPIKNCSCSTPQM